MESATSLYLSDYSNKLVLLEGYVPIVLCKNIIFDNWYLIKESGKTLIHMFSFRTSQRTTSDFFNSDYSKNLLQLGAYEPISL